MNRPTVQERLRERVCPNCGAKPERKSAKGPPPTFCSKECKRSHNNRLLVEGRAVIAFAKAWRADRGTGEIAQGSLAQMCQVLDFFNSEDLAAGRPRADFYASTLLREQNTFFDRRRK